MTLYFILFVYFSFSSILLEYFATNIVQGILASFTESFITVILAILLQIGVISKNYVDGLNSSPSLPLKLIFRAFSEGIEKS